MSLDVPDLRNDVIALRPPADRDIDAITAEVQDPHIPRFTRFPSPYVRADGEQFVQASAQHWRDGTQASFVIADAATDAVLGGIGLMRLDDARAVAEIGYWVAKAARRRGIATGAVRLLSRWAVLDLGIGRLELMTRVDNVASQGVAAAAGFVREGMLRSYATIGCGVADVVMFSLVPSDLGDHGR
jgi:RimJ/RimL family protein N-acetyltransferase